MYGGSLGAGSSEELNVLRLTAQKKEYLVLTFIEPVFHKFTLISRQFHIDVRPSSIVSKYKWVWYINNGLNRCWTSRWCIVKKGQNHYILHRITFYYKLIVKTEWSETKLNFIVIEWNSKYFLSYLFYFSLKDQSNNLAFPLWKNTPRYFYWTPSFSIKYFNGRII